MKHKSHIAIRLLVVLALALTSVVAFAQDETEDSSTAIPFIGVRFFEANDGVLVTGIIGNTPAATIDLTAGDVITAVNDDAVDALSVQEVVWRYDATDTVTLSVDRDGDTFEQDITLMERPYDLFSNPLYDIPFDLSTIGLVVSSVDGDIMVVDTVAGSQADDAGFQVGDFVTRVDGDYVDTIGEAAVAMSDLDYGDEAVFQVMRENRRIIIRIIIRDMNTTPRQFEITSTYQGEGITLGYAEDVIQVQTLSGSHTLYEIGLRPNDIITTVNGDPVNELSNIFASDGINLTVERTDGVYFFNVPTSIAPLLMFGLDAPQTQEAGEWLGLHEKQVTLGVRYMQLEPNSPYFAGTSVTNGAYIVETIAGLPAAQAGVQAGDIIIAIDGVNTTMELDLRNVIYTHQPGQQVTLEILRNGEIIELDVVLRVATS